MSLRVLIVYGAQVGVLIGRAVQVDTQVSPVCLYECEDPSNRGLLTSAATCCGECKQEAQYLHSMLFNARPTYPPRWVPHRSN